MQGRFNQAARCTCTGGAAWSLATALGAAIAIGTTAAPALGQTAPLQYDIQPVVIDSGIVSWDEPGLAGGDPEAIFSQVITSQDAFWTRLEFGVVDLAGSSREGNASFLKLTSLRDGGVQFLDSISVDQWQYHSAFFNGSAVLVELYSYPNTGENRVSVSAVWEGTKPVDSPIESQCGPTDDRVPSAQTWSARHLPVGCSAWLFEGGPASNPTCFLSAGHCTPAGGHIVEFNVPPSNADGTINFANPNDQYAIDPASIQAENLGLGNDWATYGCFPNANSGQFPGVVQGGGFNIVNSVPATDGSVLTNWGYGVDFNDATRNQTQQTDSGTYDSINATRIFYDDLDTEGGSSGSVLWKGSINAAIGIHTNGGCASGANSGTRLDRPNLQAAIANPQGICAAGGGDPCNPNAGDCFAANGTPGCENPVCCNAVCAADPFCCDTQWDQLCADDAAVVCASCGGAGAGDCGVANGTPACNDLACCEAVCAADPFCCDTEWDQSCANATAALCGDPACPGEGSCSVANGTPGCDDGECCNAVCAIDPFCCNVEWDQVCADQAILICFGCGPNGGDCFVPNGTPGCDNVECCLAVCALDLFCCDVEWDQACADQAAVTCATACPLDCPAGALDEGEPCGDDTNGGCNSEPPVFTPASCGDIFCGTSWADGGSRDTDWYIVEHGGGPISATVVSQFPAVCFIVDGIGTCEPVVAGEIGCSENCDPIADAVADLPPGTYVVFVAPGTCDGGGVFEGYPCGGGANDYVVQINCTPPPPVGACCLPTGACVDGVTQADCTAGGGVYQGDNVLCANVNCDTGPCNPDAGSCYSSNGTVGCNNPECCELVCGFDPFCCDVEWDSACAAEAAQFCGNCGSPDAGSCFADNGTVGCEDFACCALICSLDPFCCDVQWDGLCAGAADQNCTCLCDFDNDFDVDVDDLLFLLANWGGPGGDCNGDGTTDVNDLLDVLAQWGPCP